jgi:hypothetical protein
VSVIQRARAALWRMVVDAGDARVEKLPPSPASCSIARGSYLAPSDWVLKATVGPYWRDGGIFLFPSLVNARLFFQGDPSADKRGVRLRIWSHLSTHRMQIYIGSRPYAAEPSARSVRSASALGRKVRSHETRHHVADDLTCLGRRLGRRVSVRDVRTLSWIWGVLIRGLPRRGCSCSSTLHLQHRQGSNQERGQPRIWIGGVG